ncbi:helix-turn-helix domain-containing protein [Paenibacillus sp. 276b]|uniref:helix-turn-helix domain-containing protein n=1 Tax=Paenibacillus sp. 276b TaxID=1566277 RepID=UPI0008991AE2|nr:helix-turn-helix domain-containing protein [Paenibacillus sp. 276b]SEB12289.1 Helix-turn-helix domain-containing protein [Paenibacillus sp. 276b]
MLFKRTVDNLPKGRYFRRSLMMILFIACIPGVITGVLLYGWVTVKMENILQQSHLRQFEQRTAWVSEQLDALELTFSQWAFDPVFDNRLKELDFVYKYKQVHELYRLLLMIQNSNTLIGKVQLYLDEPRVVKMDSERYDFISDPSEITKMERLTEQPQATYWSRSLEGSSMMMVNRLPGGNDDALGALTVTLDNQQLGSMLQTLSPYNGGTTFLLDEQGKPMLPQDKELGGLQQAVRERVLNFETNPSSFLMEYGDITYSVQSGTFRRLGTNWTYISAAPLNEIVAPIVSVPRIVLLVNGAGLLLALILSWVGSLQLYKPFTKLLRIFTVTEAPIEAKKPEMSSLSKGFSSASIRSNGPVHLDEIKHIEQRWIGINRERESLQQRLEEHLPLARESLLIQLTLGHLLLPSDREWRERLSQLGWDLRDEQFVIMLAHIRPEVILLHGSEHHGRESQEWISFAVTDILGRQLQELPYRAETLNYHDMSIALLLAVPPKIQPDTAEFRNELMRMGQQWMDSVHSELNIRLTVVLSKLTSDASHIPQLIRESRSVLRKRQFSSNLSIMDMNEEAEQDVKQRGAYPLELEQDIISALRSGDEELALEHFGRFIDTYEGSESPEEHIRQALFQLLARIQHALLQLGENPVELFGLAMYEEVVHLHDLDELFQWFRERIVHVCVEEFTGREEKQIQMAVHQMKEHAEWQYAEALSLDELADLHGIHAYTLSRAFKQTFGQNFVDYLTEIRLNRAKELLESTDVKINEIAEQVGYQASYFNRLFKKSEGTTPSRYREDIRKQTGHSRGNRSV